MHNREKRIKTARVWVRVPKQEHRNNKILSVKILPHRAENQSVENMKVSKTYCLF